MVNAGTSITFTVKGITGNFLPRTVAQVKANAIDDLTPYFDVTDVTLDTSSIVSDPLHAISEWPYTAHVRLTTRVAYGDVRDVDAIVAHAFYDATGEMPIVTADGFEAGQGSDASSGLSLTTALIVVAVALVALAVIKVS